MNPEWCKCDSAKWAVLSRLREEYGYRSVIQINFCRENKSGNFFIDDKEEEITRKVLVRFTDFRRVSLTSRFEIFEDRDDYLKAVKEKIREYNNEKLIVFLDPDTGLQPNNTKLSLKHVLEDVEIIWEKLKPGDVFVFYQHKTNKGKEPWIEPKRNQLARLINIPNASVKMAKGPDIADDVVFFYAERP